MQIAQLFFVATGLVFIGAGAAVLFSGANRYRELITRLERPWSVERYIYRYHFAFGGAIVAGALIFLALLSRYHGISFGTLGWPATSGAQFVLLVRLAAWTFACLALPVGIIVAIRPSVLKAIEIQANRWVQPSPPALLGHSQFGILLLIAGIACLLLSIAMTSSG